MPQFIDDHDLLVRLDTKLDVLSATINEIKTTVAAKADAARVEKLEKDVDGVKTKLAYAAGGCAVLQVGLHLFLR